MAGLGAYFGWTGAIVNTLGKPLSVMLGVAIGLWLWVMLKENFFKKFGKKSEITKPAGDLKKVDYAISKMVSQNKNIVLTMAYSEGENNLLSPMEIVKQYMLDEIKSIRDTRYMLKNKYPELFSLYVI